MQTLHPLFSSIIAAHGMLPPAQQEPDAAMQVRRAAYIKALIDFGRWPGWSFEFSDDHSVWQRGRDGVEKLRIEQAAVDPDGALWKQHGDRNFLPCGLKGDRL